MATSPTRLYLTASGSVTADPEAGVLLLVGEGCDTDDPRALEWLAKQREPSRDKSIPRPSRTKAAVKKEPTDG